MGLTRVGIGPRSRTRSRQRLFEHVAVADHVNVADYHYDRGQLLPVA
jgi:hypothetical protein